jgi:hypothetical protein
LTTSYGSTTTLDASSTSHSVPLSGLTPNTTYNFRVVAYDQSGNRTNSSNGTFTTQDIFSVSAVSTTVNSATAATITWTTPQAGSTYVRYGLVGDIYSATTTEVDTSPRVTSHSVSLTGLLPCTTYHFRAFSRDASLTLASSSNNFFTTSGGCTATAAAATTTESLVTTASGATVVLAGSSGTVTIVVPTGFTSTSSSATFQAKDLNASTFFASITKPTDQSLVGSRVFNLKAFSDISTTLSTFSSPITITLSYTAGDVVGIVESALKIYRYDGSSWYALSNCSVNTSSKTVTCETSAFSDFAIFGQSDGSSSSGSSASVTPGSQTGGSSNPNFATSEESRILRQLALARGEKVPDVASVVKANSGTYDFTRSLSVGSKGDDVKRLQQFLNNNGFIIAKSGVGSKGKENGVFGEATKKALIKFQEFYKKDILTPTKLKEGTGKFGGSTAKKVNDMIKAGKK